MLKRNFLRGRMNKDADERLLPPGEVRELLNCRVSNSEGSDVGSIENCLGNERIVDLNLTNAKTIGALEDDKNERIYWFVVGDEKEGLLEWDKTTNTPTWVLEETSVGVLNLNNGKLINFIDLVYADDDIGVLIFWAQEGRPPRMANIERAKTYGLDGFIEDDISVIKKPPALAPTTQLTYTSTALENNLNKQFLTFGYRYKYLDEMYSAISFFTAYNFSPNEFEINYETFENEGMVNSFNAVNILFKTGDRRVIGIDLIVKESNSNVPYIIESFDKLKEGWIDNTEQSFLFSNNKTYLALSSIQLFRLYDNVPVLANVQEFIGNRLSYYDYYEGYDMKDCDGGNIKIDYTVGVNSTSIVGNEVITVIENDARTVDTIDLVVLDGILTIDFSGVDLMQGKRLTFDLYLEEQTVIDGDYSNIFQFILNEDYADANALAASTSFIDFIETFWTNHFNSNYALINPPENTSIDTPGEFEILSSSVTEINVRSPYIRFVADELDVNDDPVYVYAYFNFESLTQVYISEIAISSSTKSNRDLEVGLVYYDAHNRCTTVLTSNTNTVYIPHSQAINQNKLEITLTHKPPCWAVKYKFVIKQNRFDYDTIYATTFYEDGLFRWVLLEGANKDKVKQGDLLIVKSDIDGFVPELIKVSVIEIDTKIKDFIEDNEDANNEAIIEQSGLYMKIRPVGFNMDYKVNQFLNVDDYKTSKSSRPTIFLGELSRYDTATLTWVDYELKSGAKIDINLNNYESDGDQFLYSKSFIVQSDYNNFEDWFNAEVGSLGDFNDYEFVRGTFGGFLDLIFSPDPNGPLYLKVRGELSGASFERSKFRGEINIRFAFGLVILETEPVQSDSNIFYEGPDTFLIENGVHLGNIQDQDFTIPEPVISILNFFNCYVQGNGAESYKILDKLNEKFLNIDTRPNTTSLTDFKRLRRYASITNSEPFEESTNLNGLNEFNLARGNFKDLEKSYGTIKHAFYRDDNILIVQEDKWGQVLYQKDIINTADGSTSIVAIDQVLGRYIPYTGEFGISRSPESFAYFGNRVYAVDPKRGAPLRLSIDGINEINNGMVDFFKDIFRDNTYDIYIAAYDPYFDEYLLVINSGTHQFTVGFGEKGYSTENRGWTSKYSFVPEKMIGMNNHLFSFKNGNLWLHNSENVPRNNFYGIQYTSKIRTIFNEGPEDDKIFKTLVLEGNKPWDITVKTNYSESTIAASEFNSRESRWFAYIRKNEIATDLNGNSAQGIGSIISSSGLNITFNFIPGIVSIGDDIYKVDGDNNILMGTIEDIQGNVITVVAYINTPTNGWFAYSKKPSRIEGSEIRGYFMEVELENSDTDAVELFAIGTNAKKSFL